MLLRRERFKLDECGGDEDTFYLGRRALYMLQQAVEKATKEYLPFFEEVLEAFAMMTSPCENPEAKRAENELRKLANDLESSRTRRHDPYEGLLKTMNKLTRAEIKGVFVPCLEWISNLLPKRFEGVKDAEFKQIIEAVDLQIISTLVETLRKTAALYRELPSLKLEIPKIPYYHSLTTS